jgi:ABC-type Fe3+-siderophore transport system permease subunit
LTKARRVIVLALTQGSRAILVLSTILIAVFGSRLAVDFANAGFWMIVLGAAILLFCSAIGKEIEDGAQQLARAADKSVRQTRSDMFSSSRFNKLMAAFVIGVTLIVAGLIVQGVAHSPQGPSRVVQHSKHTAP